LAEARELLFSYGTLQQENVQRALFGRPLEGAPDELVGFAQQTLEIADPDVVAKSGKAIHTIVAHTQQDGDRVAGTVFQITPEELAAADAYEVREYVRVETTLASGLRAWVYVKG
jgi:gamma-glutamylcyclotransferase (GGCT)/AIG2-like uncharacterized protein YtfP